MAQAKYQITLSLNGNHQVSVAGDDPTSVNEGLAWAKGIYLKLRERALSGESDSANGQQTIYHEIRPTESATPPLCAIHNLPMVKMHGKRGEFWSCHERLPDGSWCPFRPTKPSP